MLVPSRIVSGLSLLLFLLCTSHHFYGPLIIKRGEANVFLAVQPTTALVPCFRQCRESTQCAASHTLSPGSTPLRVSAVSLPAPFFASPASSSSRVFVERELSAVQQLCAAPANAPQGLPGFLPGCTLHTSLFSPVAPLSREFHKLRRRNAFSNGRAEVTPGRGRAARCLRAAVRDRRLPSLALDQLQRLLEAKQYEVKLLVEKHGSLLDPLALRQAYVHHTLNSKLTERMRIQPNAQERDEKIRALHAARWDGSCRETREKEGEERRQEGNCEHVRKKHSRLVGEEKPGYDLQEVLQETETPHRLSVACDLKRRSCTNMAVNPRRLSYRNPGDIAVDCASAGADIILVNTNKEGWGGSYDDLQATTKALRNAYTWSDRPAVVMKDIIIHPIQVAQAVEAKADGVYLHFCILGKDLEDLLFACSTMGTQALVEVHSEAEAQQAEDAGATLLVVNQWDRYTGRLVPEQALRVRSVCSPEVIVLASGGLTSLAQAAKCAKCGFDGVVLGQALTRPGALDFIKEVKSWQGAPRELVHLFAPNPRGAAAAARGLEDAAAAVEEEEAALKAEREARRAAERARSKEGQNPTSVSDGEAFVVDTKDAESIDDSLDEEDDLDVAEKVFEEAKRGWTCHTGAERKKENFDEKPTERRRARESEPDDPSARDRGGVRRKERAESCQDRIRNKGFGCPSLADSELYEDENSETLGKRCGQMQGGAGLREEFTERILRLSGPDFQPRQPAASAFGSHTVPAREGDAVGRAQSLSSLDDNCGDSASPSRKSGDGGYPAPPPGIVDVSGEEDEHSQRVGSFHAFSSLRAPDNSSGRERTEDPQKKANVFDKSDSAPNEEQVLRAFTRELLGQIARERQVHRMAEEEHRDQQLAMFRQYQQLARAFSEAETNTEAVRNGSLFVPPLALQEQLQSDPHFRASGPAKEDLDPLAVMAQDADTVAEPFKEAFPNDPARAAAACTAAAAAAVADPAGFAAVARDHLEKAAERGAYTLADANDPAMALSAAAPTFAAASATAALTAAVARGERDASTAAKAAAATLKGTNPPNPNALAALAAAAIQRRKASGIRPDLLGVPLVQAGGLESQCGEEQRLATVGGDSKIVGASLTPHADSGFSGTVGSRGEGRGAPGGDAVVGLGGGQDEKMELFDEAELERIGRLFFSEEELDGFLKELRAKKATRQSAQESSGAGGPGSPLGSETHADRSTEAGFCISQQPERAGEVSFAPHQEAAVDTQAGVRTGTESSSPMSQGPIVKEKQSDGEEHEARDDEEKAHSKQSADENGSYQSVQMEKARGHSGTQDSVENQEPDSSKGSRHPSESYSEPHAPLSEAASRDLGSETTGGGPASSWRVEKVFFNTQEWFARADRRKKEDHELEQQFLQQSRQAAAQMIPCKSEEAAQRGLEAIDAPEAVSAAGASEKGGDASFGDGGRETFSRFGRHTPEPSLTTPMDQMEAFLPFFQGHGSHHHLDDPPEVQERMQQEAFLEELKQRGSGGSSSETSLDDSSRGLPRTGHHAYELLKEQQRLQAERQQLPPPAAALKSDAVTAAASAAAAALAEGASPQAAVRAVKRVTSAGTSSSPERSSLEEEREEKGASTQNPCGETDNKGIPRSDAATAAAVQGAMLGGERGAYAALLGTSSQGAGGFFESYVDDLAKTGGMEVETRED
uniref:indole-3-glycerol-phosphate synthase n=1 Tax=Toxoplasma gondii COUG TaxID=1074873 RepID=A0A2G8XM90_TOXGO|nr:indole-3-glycerol phosphate synthase domain-containing protein [Toxoplasma gondii COUG]